MSILDFVSQQQSPSLGGTGGIGALGAGNSIYPQSRMDKTQYATPMQLPTSAEVISSDYDPKIDAYTGMPSRFAKGGIASIQRFADGGGPESEGKVFVGDENSGRWVDPSELNTAPKEEEKPLTMAELAGQIKTAYRNNANYDNLWKQFESLKSNDPKEWYAHQLDFLGNQVGWQLGQNTGERVKAIQPQIDATIADAKKAGLSQNEIDKILDKSSKEANVTNQNRIAQEAAEGKGWVNQNIPGGWTTVGALAAAAAAPYALGALAGEGAGALTTTELINGAGGAFVPTAGSGASFALPAGAYTAAGATGIEALAPEIAKDSAAYESLIDFAAKEPMNSGLLNPAKEAATGMTTAQKVGLGLLSLKALEGGSGGSGSSYPTSTTTTTQAPPTQNIASQQYNPFMNYAAMTMPGMSSNMPGAYYQPLTYKYYAQGGLADMGGYAVGGKLLKGAGDGMSDDIHANIDGSQPARLADGEFVIPADVVSHLGNGSTDAGAKQLYRMMDKIRQARTGNKKQGKQINPEKFFPKG